MKSNVYSLQVTRDKAVEQINEMESIVRDLGREVVKKSLPGEVVETEKSNGVQMIAARL